jgi:transposase
MSDSSPSEYSNPRSVSGHQKVDTVLRLLAGEAAQSLAHEIKVSEERILQWKERFIEGGRANLLQRRQDNSKRSQARKKSVLQWTAVFAGLVVVIWIATRFLGSSATVSQ